MGAPYNSFTFDNINSLTEGVYISGSSAFNAPERDVEMIVIPGRNGEFIRDNGRFNNIEVTYPCGVVGDSTDFKTKMQNIRNKLASKRGYCRLVDTYNPNEYRMGVFKDAIEVEPVAQNTAGQFEVVFNCKPQRYLISGETKTTVTSGSTVTNPTPFDAQPMIMTKGYGTLTVNGYEISIKNEQIGDFYIADNESFVVPKTFVFNPVMVNNGDTIDLNGSFKERTTTYYGTVQSITNTNASFTTTATGDSGANTIESFFQLSITAGTDQTKTNTATIVYYSALTGTTTITFTQTITYNAYAGTITYNSTISSNKYTHEQTKTDIIGHSTVSTLGNPTYIDCELGEVYKVESGSYISLNRLTDLGSNLPVLSPGENEITFDNTFTSVEIIPHWWVV